MPGERLQQCATLYIEEPRRGIKAPGQGCTPIGGEGDAAYQIGVPGEDAPGVGERRGQVQGRYTLIRVLGMQLTNTQQRDQLAAAAALIEGTGLGSQPLRLRAG